MVPYTAGDLLSGSAPGHRPLGVAIPLSGSSPRPLRHTGLRSRHRGLSDILCWSPFLLTVHPTTIIFSPQTSLGCFSRHQYPLTRSGNRLPQIGLSGHHTNHLYHLYLRDVFRHVQQPLASGDLHFLHDPLRPPCVLDCARSSDGRPPRWAMEVDYVSCPPLSMKYVRYISLAKSSTNGASRAAVFTLLATSGFIPIFHLIYLESTQGLFRVPIDSLTVSCTSYAIGTAAYVTRFPEKYCLKRFDPFVSGLVFSGASTWPEFGQDIIN